MHAIPFQAAPVNAAKVTAGAAVTIAAVVVFQFGIQHRTWLDMHVAYPIEQAMSALSPRSSPDPWARHAPDMFHNRPEARTAPNKARVCDANPFNATTCRTVRLFPKPATTAERAFGAQH